MSCAVAWWKPRITSISFGVVRSATITRRAERLLSTRRLPFWKKKRPSRKMT